MHLESSLYARALQMLKLMPIVACGTMMRCAAPLILFLYAGRTSRRQWLNKHRLIFMQTTHFTIFYFDIWTSDSIQNDNTIQQTIARVQWSYGIALFEWNFIEMNRKTVWIIFVLIFCLFISIAMHLVGYLLDVSYI